LKGEGESTEPVKDLSSAVYVGKIPKHFEEHDMLTLFGKYGEIKQLDVVRDTRKKNPKKNRGFSFITYKTTQAAKDAIKAMNNHVLEGNAIVVVPARKGRFEGKEGGPKDKLEQFRLREVKKPTRRRNRTNRTNQQRLKAFLDDIDTFPLPTQHIYTDEGPMHVRRGLSVSMSPKSHTRSFRSCSPGAYEMARAEFARRNKSPPGYAKAKEEFRRRYHEAGKQRKHSPTRAYEAARKEYARQGYESALHDFSVRYGSPRSYEMAQYGYEAARAEFLSGSPMGFSNSRGIDSFSPRQKTPPGFPVFKDVLGDSSREADMPVISSRRASTRPSSKQY